MEVQQYYDKVHPAATIQTVTSKEFSKSAGAAIISVTVIALVLSIIAVVLVSVR